MSEHLAARRRPPRVRAVPETEPQTTVEPDVEDDEPLRWYVIAAFMLLVIGGFAVTAVLVVGWYTDCDDGRHVSPFVAGDSLRGQLCYSHHRGAGLLIPAGWLVGLGVATVALVRWGGGRLRAVVSTVLLLAPLVLPVASYAALARTGTTCTGDKREAFRAWADDGSKGTPPYDCRTF
jgi:hypothetical protein